MSELAYFELKKWSFQLKQDIMDFMMNLRTYFEKKYSEYYVSGSIYYGYMDMTYFSFTPKALKEKKLKIAIVFIHMSASFEIWLSGYNKSIQKKYWKYFKEKKLKKYYVPEDIKRIDSIVNYKIKEKSDFNDLNKLRGKIEKETLSFVKDIIVFLKN